MKFYYAYPTEGITSTFNATTKKGSITAGNNLINYKNIEQLEISGTSYDDRIIGSSGNDSLDGGINGNFYTEYGVYSTTGNNTLIGGAGDDRLIVDYSSGNNLLEGGDGNDHLSAAGAVGNNSFNGGLGDDILTGGEGADTFVFESSNQGLDRLENFSTTNDRIQISSAGFGGGLLTGTLETSQFTLGTSTTTSEERFIYNSATGALYFDLDGSASGFTQVQFAQLSTGLSLTNNNFVVG